MKNLQHSYSDMFTSIFTGRCVHWPMQSPTGVGHLEIPSYALKTQLTSSRCRTKNTDSLSDNKTHYNLSESLSLSHTDILLTRHSLQWHTSLKSPNCDLPVKKQTILLCHTDTRNMLLHKFVTNKLHQFKHRGLSLRHVSFGY